MVYKKLRLWSHAKWMMLVLFFLALTVLKFPSGSKAQTVAAAEERYAAAVLSDHPVAYYRLNELSGAMSAKDRSGNGHNGTYENNPTLGVPGLITGPNKAADLTSGDVVIPDSPSLNFVDLPFTIEAWVELKNPGPINGRIFDKIVPNVGQGYGLDMNYNNLRLLGNPELQFGGTSAPFLPNTIYHIVGVSDGVGTGYLYVNGTLVFTGPFQAPSPYTGPAHIAIASDGSAHWNGILDEVAVYNYVLPFQRIVAHYEQGTACK